MKRSGQTVAQDMTLTSWDTPDGRLVRFESRMSAGPGEIVSVGAVQRGNARHRHHDAGPHAIAENSLAARVGRAVCRGAVAAPLAAQARRKADDHSLLPVMNLPADTRLEALDFETVDLPAGRQKLLKVSNVVEVGPQKIESVVWTDQKGDTVKSLVPSIGQEAVRTTKADALKQPAGEQYDLLLASTVRLKQPLANAHQTKRVVYRAHLKSGQIEGLFSDGLIQRVKRIDDQTEELTVIAVRPDAPARLDRPQDPPTEADRAPNNFIQSDDRVIAQMAARVASDETDPWKIACGLESFVDETVTNKNSRCPSHRSRSCPLAGRGLHGARGIDGRLMPRPQNSGARGVRPGLLSAGARLRLSHVE